MTASANLGNLTDLEMVERHRASFNEKVAEMQDAASKNSKFLTRADQDKKVARLLALNNVGEVHPGGYESDKIPDSFEHWVKWADYAKIDQAWLHSQICSC